MAALIFNSILCIIIIILITIQPSHLGDQTHSLTNPSASNLSHREQSLLAITGMMVIVFIICISLLR